MLVLAMKFSRDDRLPSGSPGREEGTAERPRPQVRTRAEALPHNGTEEVRPSA